MNRLHFPPLVLLPLIAACAAQSGPQSTAAPATTVTIGIAAINDFHGALEPPRTSVLAADGRGGAVQVPAGGAAWLASAADAIRAKYPNHLTVSAGDMIGASQLASSLFLDEPTIEVMNRIGIDFNAIGNHEFDRGADELLRIQRGGCAQHTLRKPCQLEVYKGAKFAELAANTNLPDGKTLFPATALRRFGKGKTRVTIGLIGVTLAQTGDLTNREGLAGIRFADEATTINPLVDALKKQGAAAIIVLIHQGGYTVPPPDPSGCNGLTGGIVPILGRLDPRIDLIVSGHTHWAYVCDYKLIDPVRPFLLTSAGVNGQLITDITLEIDPKAQRVLAKSAQNLIVQSLPYPARNGTIANTTLYPQLQPRADIAAYVAKYVEASQGFIKRNVGTLAGPVMRPGGDASREGGTLGYLIADAQLAATAGAGAEIAFMNPFGIRSPHNLTPAADASLSFGQLYAVQPFANTLVTQSLTGAAIREVLEQGFDANQPLQALSPSTGFAYSFDLSRPVGSRVLAITLNGRPLDPARTYRVTTNSFLANGGDSFAGFANQRDAVIGGSDIDALEAWLKAVPPRAVPAESRVTEISHP